MYTVEDETFVQARAILSSLAAELDAQQASGSHRAVYLRKLVRSAAVGVPRGGEAEYVRAIADTLERSFSISELFPRKRRARNS